MVWHEAVKRALFILLKIIELGDFSPFVAELALSGLKPFQSQGPPPRFVKVTPVA